jgi:hypothetical protein
VRRRSAALLYDLMVTPLSAWALMLLIGVLHSQYGWPRHTLGFWMCVVLVVLASTVTTAFKLPWARPDFPE